MFLTLYEEGGFNCPVGLPCLENFVVQRHNYFATQLSILILKGVLLLYSPRVCLLFDASSYSLFVACKVEPRSGVKARTLLLQVENHKTLETTTSPHTSEHHKQHQLFGSQPLQLNMQWRWDYPSPNEYIVGAWEPKTSNHK